MRNWLHWCEELSADQLRSKSPDARELVQNLIELEAEAQSDDAPASADAALATSDRLYRELSRWVGTSGCHALFTRALADARSSHPLLIGVRLQNDTQPHFEGTAEIIEAFGASATAEAVEAVLVALVELLGRLIGDDMAMKLILQSLPGFVHDTIRPEATRAEA